MWLTEDWEALQDGKLKYFLVISNKLTLGGEFKNSQIISVSGCLYEKLADLL